MSDRTFLTVVADEQGEVFELPELLLAGMNGYSIVRPEDSEMIPLPPDSRLFTIPHTPPMGFDPRTGKQKTVEQMPKKWGGQRIQAVSAFLSPGFTRILLPAADYNRKTKMFSTFKYFRQTVNNSRLPTPFVYYTLHKIIISFAKTTQLL